jgi:IS30 family transposase
MAQLTLAQRFEIQIGLSLNQPYSQIGSTIDKDKPVVSREIKRNSDARNGKYRAQLAHEKATNRHTDKNKKYVEMYLVEKFNPEQIVGRAILDGISCVSHETIYQ